MKKLERVGICNGLANLLLLRVGDREYYIDPDAGVAYEGLVEAMERECPRGDE